MAFTGVPGPPECGDVGGLGPREAMGAMAKEQLRGQAMATDPAQWVDQHGDYLFRFALSRLRQREVAEDLVQETFVAALRARKRFAGASSERTWLTGILKRKIVDYFRRKGHEQPASDLSTSDHWVEALFDERGNWKKKPGKWPS